MNKSVFSHRAASVAACLFLISGIGVAEDLNHYPDAARGNHSDSYHGVTVDDPYRWLEDTESSAVKAWEEKQALLLTDFIKTDRRDEIMQRIERLTGFKLYGNPMKAGDRYFYTQSVAAQASGALLVQKGFDDKARIILDPAEFDANDERLAAVAPVRTTDAAVL